MSVEKVRVGEVLKLQRREVFPDGGTEYSLIGVYSFGKGIFHREPTSGLELGDYRFFAIMPGDLVLSNIQAWEGAIALASDRDKGAIGTHRFLSYAPVDDRIDTNWARWFFLSEPGMELIRQAAPGTTMRNRTLAIERFEALPILLPALGEQRRVAASLDRIYAGGRGLEQLASRSREISSAFAVSLASRGDLDDDARSGQGWCRIKLGTVMASADDVVTVDIGSSYPNVGIYSFGRGLFTKPNIEGAQTSAKTLNRLHAGQFVYSRLFAFEGAYAYVELSYDGSFVSNEFPAFDPDPERLDARWLATYLRSPDRWAELSGASKGLGVRRQRIPVEALLAYEVWLPSLNEQQQMVRSLKRLEQAEADRSSVEARIKSLVPAALNEAFAGLR